MKKISTSNTSLVEIQNLKKYFPVGRSKLKAIDDISFSITAGETFGLVGESGCGKTTTGRAILRLIEPTEGKIFFEKKSILEFSHKQMREQRREMQIIFQDPYSSLNPRMKVGQIVAEPLIIHKIGTSITRRERVTELLNLVGLAPESITRYPHEFSGGQRQRIGIARALALNPKFIVADEPVSALDVSIQAQIVNLLQDLQEKLNLTYLFISHGLAIVEYLCTTVGVMYLGKIVEIAPSKELYSKPLHPYTQALLNSIPIPDPAYRHHRKDILGGDIPTPLNIPSGCRFHTRCPYAKPECQIEEPPMLKITPDHQVACWLVK